jgi:hypothetical protein
LVAPGSGGEQPGGEAPSPPSGRSARVARARELREQGLLLREIGEMMGVSPKTVHVWLADPDGSVARERKRRYHDGVCRDCGDPCYRYWSHWQGGHTPRACVQTSPRQLVARTRSVRLYSVTDLISCGRSIGIAETLEHYGDRTGDAGKILPVGVERRERPNHIDLI